MSDLTKMLVLQSRMHKKHGANALSQLFDSATERIEELEVLINQQQKSMDELKAENEELKYELRERPV
jgi:cell division protein FtsB